MAYQYPAPQVKLDPVDDTILLGVHRGESLQETGERIGCTHRWVKSKLHALQDDGYIVYIPRKARGRYLTVKGKEYLERRGLLKEDK